ncbi:MFS transporter, partial [Alphaproteobacteria bacterium]|nr:MFS transporter [Alphaproteobacteria bacterium]
MALTVVYAGMQFLFGPLIGSLSDRFGRRPVLLLSIGALGLDYILLAIAPTVFLLFIGRIIAGIAGATQSTAVAVAADLSDGENRAKTMGLVFAGFGLGFIIGPALGGLLGWLGTEQPAFLGPQLQAFFGQLGNRAPMYMAALLSLANFAFGFFVFKESLPLKNRRPFSLLRANPLGAILSIRHLRGIFLLLAVIFLFGVAQVVYPAVWSFFARAAVGWNVGQVGLSLTIVGIGFFVVQAVLVGPLTKRFGGKCQHRKGNKVEGLGFNLIAFTVLTFARQDWLIWAGIPISALGILVGPAASALLSKSVDETRQGEVQGISASLNAIAFLIGPIILTNTFSFYTGSDAPVFWPGAPFGIAALIVVVCIPLMILFLRGRQASSAVEEHAA